METRKLLGMIAAAAMVVACGAGADAQKKAAPDSKDAGPKAVFDKMAGLSEALVVSVEKADSPDTLAAAFNAYSDGMEKLIPQIKAALEKHPGLKGKIGTKDVDVPAEFKPSLDRITTAGDKMWDAMKKAEPHLKGEAVEKAQERLSAVMANME